jgi:hypothetical protein
MDDMLRERALTNLVDAAKPIDKDGNPVDLTPVVIEPKEQESEEEPADAVEDSPEASDADAPDESEETS